MKPEEVVKELAKTEHVIIRHRGQIFFNTTDEKEMTKWVEKGARAVPHFEQVEIQTRAKKGRKVTQGWEVHLLSVLDPEWAEDEDGNEVNIAGEKLRELCTRTS